VGGRGRWDTLALNLIRSAGSVSAQAEAAGEDLFSATSYSDWVRAAVRVREAALDVAMLFDSTISEPTQALIDVVREAFSHEVTSRYVSVFADGNRYAVDALARRYGLSPDQIVTTTGATGALNMVLKALVAPGDHVLVERPGFDFLGRLARDAGAVVGEVERRAPGFSLDPDDLHAQLTPRTRAVIVTNLHNPSGARLSPDEIAAAARRLAPSGVVLVVDEVYADFAADAGAPPAATLAPNIVTVSSLTKVLGLFALRFGWLAANTELLERLKARAPDGDLGVSKLSHAVAAHVLERPQAFEGHWRQLLAANRPLVAACAEDLRQSGIIEGSVPEHGCMYFPRVAGVDDTATLARRLFERHGVLVAPGEYFGAPGRLRIGYGADTAALRKGLDRLSAALRAEHRAPRP
jgi:aspartate/methionine/tyrosine aminotransferase